MLSFVTTIPAILATDEGVTQDPMVKGGLLLVMVAVVLGMIMMGRRRRTREPDIRDYAREQAAKVRQGQGVRDDLEQIFVQISDLARQLNAQMDTRFAKLEQAMADADRKIATLEGLLRRAAGVKGIDVTIGDEPAEEPAAGTPDPQSAKAPQPQPARLPESPSANGGKGRKQGKKPARTDKAGNPDAPASKANEPAPAKPATGAKGQASADGGDVRYTRVYQLADQGLPLVEIARQTGQTTGEIELILNLRKSRSR